MNIPPALAISLTGYLKSLAARNVSELTTPAYRTDLTQFFTWLAENDLTVTHPSYITRSHIIDCLSHLASQGRSGVTRARKLAVIQEYSKFLVDEGTLASSPAATIAMLKKERKSRVFLRVDEYMRLLNAATGHSRDYAILHLFLQTGIRVAELAGLTLSDIDLDAQTMLLTAKATSNAPCTW